MIAPRAKDSDAPVRFLARVIGEFQAGFLRVSLRTADDAAIEHDINITLVPEDLRVANRILKNAGYVPPELDALRQLAQLEQLVYDECTDAIAHAKAVKKLALLRTRIEAGYYGKAVARLSR